MLGAGRREALSPLGSEGVLFVDRRAQYVRECQAGSRAGRGRPRREPCVPSDGLGPLAEAPSEMRWAHTFREVGSPRPGDRRDLYYHRDRTLRRQV